MPSETAETTATTRVAEETARTTTTTRGEIAEKRSLAPSLDVEPLRPAEDRKATVATIPEPEVEEERAKALAESAGPRKKSFALITGIDPKMRLPYKEITYDPSNRVDPFAPLVREEPEQQEVAKRKEKRERKRRVPRTPLEKFDLSQLKLVGIVASDSGNIALVEESTGKGYIVKEGTYIGTRAGKVVEITRNKIVVEEEDEDFLGNITLRKRELKIQKPPGEDYYEM
jgi:type IV pilus assembly protein PilP